jgi:autophagy-related protein 2
VEEMTFRKIVPEVGPAPDLIEDDLPSNTDYIDDSYGTAGGFRALEDDAFEDDEEFAITGLTEQDVPDNVTILAGGETIRMLTSEKLHVEEHHFDTLPPEANQMDMP